MWNNKKMLQMWLPKMSIRVNRAYNSDTLKGMNLKRQTKTAKKINK